MQKEYSGAIYIIGPDNKKYYKPNLNFLKDRIDNVIVIGDGENDILDSKNEGPLQKIKTIDQDYPELSKEGKVLVYIEAHGVVWDNTHYIQIAKDDVMASKELFKLLAENIKIPIDIIFTPCNGKAALTDINVLPKDSRVIIFSDSDKITNAQNIASTLNTLPKDNFTLNNFYNNYLSGVFSMNESPVMHIVGRETIDPLVLSETYLKAKVSESSRQYVHNHFGQSICNNDISCHNEIDSLINKVEQAISMDEFKVVASENYFTALSEFFTQMNTEYKFARNNNHHRDVSYNYKDPEYCYTEILELKSKADQLLLKLEIPLELDLSHQLWYNIDFDYPTDKELGLMKESSDECLFYAFKYEGFTENNNFIKPSHGEYGLTLGIIKDIHLSLSLADDSELV